MIILFVHSYTIRACYKALCRIKKEEKQQENARDKNMSKPAEKTTQTVYFRSEFAKKTLAIL